MAGILDSVLLSRDYRLVTLPAAGPLAPLSMVKDTFELYALTFSKSFKTISLDCREVYEHVFRAIVRSDEAEAFVSVEPFYDTSHFTGHSVLPLIIKCAFRRYGVLYRF